MITIIGALVVLAVLAVARYGADTRFDSGPDPRDAARPRGPQYAHTPAADLRLLAELARRIAAHGRAWAGLRPRPAAVGAGPAGARARVTWRCRVDLGSCREP